uniref:Uncharacterized protein n=1 Tax=Anguilla anguilla TaxID=7936 RepID=A0A0E9SFW1_ANGAN
MLTIFICTCKHIYSTHTIIPIHIPLYKYIYMHIPQHNVFIYLANTKCSHNVTGMPCQYYNIATTLQ